MLVYISVDRPEAPAELLNDIDRAISSLEDYPESGKIPADLRLRRMGYRILIVGTYLVFYVIKGKAVEMRRILHGHRKYEFLR
ncbi:MAG: type II toxin-antitoxin system RelE/ParE family toxin [Candidatus Eremiobacteraeota bacterium]|nr:type II toxin-antitoxin system RelE/ParE family toxin [Candidatus Eremiobacteraeota bacterium]